MALRPPLPPSPLGRAAWSCCHNSFVAQLKPFTCSLGSVHPLAICKIQTTTMQGFIFVVSAFCAILARTSHAWTSTPPCSKPPRSYTTSLHATLTSSSALSFQSGNHETATFGVTDEDTEIRLQVALQAARDADRRYGLCTPESVDAWRLVDDIYSASSASRQVEDNVKRVLGREESVWGSFERGYAA